MNTTATKPTLTPLMQQWTEVKAAQSPNTLVMVRLGDFYELFNEDAKTAAKVLTLTLTHRQGVPMAGVPYHAVDRYKSLLIAAGYTVATVEFASTRKAS